MFCDGLRAAGEEVVILLTRAAYPGSQKFGSAVCGIPWWSSNIGGFHSGDAQSEDFRELVVRWFRFGLSAQ